MNNVLRTGNHSISRIVDSGSLKVWGVHYFNYELFLTNWPVISFSLLTVTDGWRWSIMQHSLYLTKQSNPTMESNPNKWMQCNSVLCTDNTRQDKELNRGQYILRELMSKWGKGVRESMEQWTTIATSVNRKEMPGMMINKLSPWKRIRKPDRLWHLSN